jgi:hypothetical protein
MDNEKMNLGFRISSLVLPPQGDYRCCNFLFEQKIEGYWEDDGGYGGVNNTIHYVILILPFFADYFIVNPSSNITPFSITYVFYIVKIIIHKFMIICPTINLRFSTNDLK